MEDLLKQRLLKAEEVRAVLGPNHSALIVLPGCGLFVPPPDKDQCEEKDDEEEKEEEEGEEEEGDDRGGEPTAVTEEERQELVDYYLHHGPGWVKSVADVWESKGGILDGPAISKDMLLGWVNNPFSILWKRGIGWNGWEWE